MKSRRFPSAFLLLLILLISSSAVSAQASDQVADLFARLNRERTTRGKLPYALNSKLTQAAQAHANDMSVSGKLSHTGSDGSTVFVRIARAGYGSYSWGYRAGENWAWYHDTATAMEKWMASKPHRDNILHDVYREIGIGIAKGPGGGYIYVVDFGAQPNVLPFFVNDGAATTASQNVVLTLNDEDVYDSAPANIQHISQVQISNQSDFAVANWQPFADHIPWTLAPGTGGKTVFVKYRDARGRTVTAAATIGLGTSGAPNSPPPKVVTSTNAPSTKTRTPTVTRTVRPSPSATPTKKPSATPTRTSTVTRTPRPSLSPTGSSLSGVRFGPQAASANKAVDPTLTPEPTEPIQVIPSPPPTFTPVVLASETPPPTFAAASISLASQIEQPTVTVRQIAFVPTEIRASEPDDSQPDFSAVASNPSASGAESTDYNPLEAFAYGFLAVGFLTGGFAMLKLLFRSR